MLAPLFSDLPKPVLAALIIEAVVMGMMDVPGDAAALPRPAVRLLGRGRRHRSARWSSASWPGVMIGIGLSLLWLDLGRHAAAASRRSAREPGTQVFRDLDEHPDDEPVPGVVVDPDGRRPVLRHVGRPRGPGPGGHPRGPGVTGIVLDCGGINFVDSQGSAKLDDVLDLAEDSGVALRLARLKPAVRATLERDGVIERLGADHIHGNVHRAVEAQRRARAASPDA